MIDEIETLKKHVALIEMATQDNFFDLELKTDIFSFPIDGRERLAHAKGRAFRRQRRMELWLIEGWLFRRDSRCDA
ncbi:MAG: hypothetical protein ACKVGZ_19265 [Alphaproteobacteria bacterium]